MKILLILILAPLFSFGRKKTGVIISSVNPNTISAFNKYDAADNGVRKLAINLQFSGKSRSVKYFKITIKGASVASPEIMTDEFPITPQDVSRGTMTIDATIKLKPLECMTSDDTFAIIISSLLYKKEIISPPIIIHKIPIPDKTSVRLVEETLVINPFYRSSKSDDGNRNIVLSLLLLGKKADATNPEALNFYIPNYIHSPSEPSLANNLNFIISKKLFSDNGCPVTLRVPLNIKLQPIDSSTEEEQVPIIASSDSLHADKLAIRKSLISLSSKNETKKTDTISRIKNSFSHACVSGHNFIVTLDPENSHGGLIRVMDEKAKVPYEYQYEGYFHTGDFTNWLVNIFTSLRLVHCGGCSACATYLAERVLEELNLLKELPVPLNVSNSKVSALNIATATKDSLSKSSPPKDSTSDAKATNLSKSASTNQADTFNYTIAYADTSVYKLSIIKSNESSVIKMCSENLTKCKEQEVVAIDKTTLIKTIPYLILKLKSDETLDTNKIVPSADQIYSNYEKDIAQKQPKEKTVAEVQGITAANNLENEPSSKIAVGKLYLKDTIVNVYSNSGIILKKIRIDSASLMIEAGKIVRRSLQIVTPSGTFWNRDAPISVRRVNLRKDDILENMDDPQHSFIRLAFLHYDDNGSYVADDVDRLVLTPSKRSSELTAGNNLNSLVNFSLYTDLIGLLGRKPNGLLNTDVTGKFITNTSNWWNLDLTPFSFIEANLVLSKFDSKFKSIDSASLFPGKNNQKDTIDRMQLMQAAWLKGSLKINVFSIRTYSAQFAQLNVGAAINVVDADSLFKKNSPHDIIFFEYFIEPVYHVNQVKNFGMEVSLKYIFQRLADKEPFANIKWKFVFNPHIAFAYYPGSDQSKQVYLRFNYFAGRAKSDDNFYQLQFGWKTGLNLNNTKKQ